MDISTSQEAGATAAPMYAIVELVGHARERISGRVSAAAIGGVPFVRVDVPSAGDDPPFTRLLGGLAIYSITPVDEPYAVSMASVCRARPVRPMELDATVRLVAGIRAMNPDAPDPAF